MAATTKVQPRARGRRSYKELFLAELKKLSGNEQKPINNNTLRTALGWEEEKYRRIKDGLAAENAIIAGRGGLGGAVGLAAIPGDKARLRFMSSCRILIRMKN